MFVAGSVESLFPVVVAFEGLPQSLRDGQQDQPSHGMELNELMDLEERPGGIMGKDVEFAGGLGLSLSSATGLF